MSEPTASQLADNARHAARQLARTPRRDKDRALGRLAELLLAGEAQLLSANEADVAAATQAGVPPSMLARLTLTSATITAMACAVQQVHSFEDPIGQVASMSRRPNDLSVGRVRVPLGVILMIYEARPNVTTDAAALAIKSGNAVLLRGGKEAARSNQALGELVAQACRESGLPEHAAQIVPAADREQIRAFLAMTGRIDLAIPRGGVGLIRFVTEHARVPVIQHFEGVCHLYVDQGADPRMAAELIADSKLARVSACNSLECLLVHQSVVLGLAPHLGAMIADRGLELRADDRIRAAVPAARPLGRDDLGKEFLDKILAACSVGSLDEALDHIVRYGSQHTEAIVTPHYQHAERFQREVDASCVVVNASTRFNDGGELGLGAEMGISTSKLHAYGPMGLEHLTTQKWLVRGDGQVRG